MVHCWAAHVAASFQLHCPLVHVTDFSNFCYETTLLSLLQLFCTMDNFTARTRNFSNVLVVTRSLDPLSLHSSIADPNLLVAFFPPLSFPMDCSSPLPSVVLTLPFYRLNLPYLSAHLFTILTAITFNFAAPITCLTSFTNLSRPTAPKPLDACCSAARMRTDGSSRFELPRWSFNRLRGFLGG